MLAWEALHKPSSAEEEDDDESDPSMELWQNKHYSGKASIGASKSEKVLPNFDIIEDPLSMPSLADLTIEKEGRSGNTVPPVFAVEVEELPRGAMIEWQAHMGIVAGSSSVKLFYHEAGDFEDDRWCICQCVVDDSVIYSLVMIPWGEEKGKVLTALEGAMSILGTIVEKAHAAYVDSEVWETDRLHSGGIILPCRSIWGMAGSQRLAAVLMFETLC